MDRNAEGTLSLRLVAIHDAAIGHRYSTYRKRFELSNA